MDTGKQQNTHNQDQIEEKHYSPLSAMTSAKLRPSHACSNQLTSLYTGRSKMNTIGDCEPSSSDFSFYRTMMGGRNFMRPSNISVDHNGLNAFPSPFATSLPSTVPTDLPEDANDKNFFQNKAEDIIARNAHFLPKSPKRESPEERGLQFKRNAEDALEDGRNEAGSQEESKPNISIDESNRSLSGDSNDTVQSVQNGVQQAGSSFANAQFKRQNGFREDEETYRKKRDKNNAAAKRSRDKKKQMELSLQTVTESLYKKCVDQHLMIKKVLSKITALEQQYEIIQENIKVTNEELTKHAKRLSKSGYGWCSHSM